MLIGTAIGTKAMVVPLTICAIPFEIRLIEEILSEVPYSIIEAAKIDGASNLKIIIFIKWGCKVPYLINALGITLINIIGYSAMPTAPDQRFLAKVAQDIYRSLISIRIYH